MRPSSSKYDPACDNPAVNKLSYLPAGRHGWLKKPLGSLAYRDWLSNEGSLTRRLQLHCRDFSVRGVRLSSARPQRDEAALLQLKPRQHALLREVQLSCDGVICVFAHSVIPHASLRGPWRGLGRLGNRPLGGALFADPRVKRTHLQFKPLHAHHPLFQRASAHLAAPPCSLWARRSVFRLGRARLLVTEVFLPELLY